jgi:hypothetical protein
MLKETVDIHHEIIENAHNLGTVVETLKWAGKEGSKNFARQRGENESLPLHTVMRHGRVGVLELVQQLTKLYPDGVKTKNSMGELPIHLMNSNHDEAPEDLFGAQKLLLEAFPDGSKTQDKSGRLPLHKALEDGTDRFAELLLQEHPEGCKEEDTHGDLPIHYAARRDKASMTQAVLTAYPKGAKHTNEEGQVPLHMVWSVAVTNLLLEAYPEGCQIKDTADGRLPMHTSMFLDQTATIVQLLVDTYPEGCQVKNRYGDLPIHELLRCSDPKEGDWFDTLTILATSYPEALTMENGTGELPRNIMPLSY